MRTLNNNKKYIATYTCMYRCYFSKLKDVYHFTFYSVKYNYQDFITQRR